MRRVYQRRQRYRRIPLDSQRWKRLGSLAENRGMKTRTELAAWVLRDFIDRGGYELTLTVREKDWLHAQNKIRKLREPDEELPDFREVDRQQRREIEKALELEREEQWLRNGAPLLRGSTVTRKDLA